MVTSLTPGDTKNTTGSIGEFWQAVWVGFVEINDISWSGFTVITPESILLQPSLELIV